MELPSSFFQVVSGLISGAAFLIYIANIIWGNTRPSRSSWWIIGVVWIIFLFSSLSLAPGISFLEKWNALAGNWILLAYIVGSFAIAILSLWCGSSDRWGMFDYLCAIFAALAVFLFFVTENSLWSLIFSTIADFCGILPTIRNAWKFPQHEHFFAWFLESISGILVLFAITRWSFDLVGVSDWASPIYLVIMNTLITTIILLRHPRAER